MTTDWQDPRKPIDPTATPMVDRGGVRVRYYKRKDPTRPGSQERRRKRRAGVAWCLDCRAWLPTGDVHQGRCRQHKNAADRARYAADQAYRTRRKRNTKLQKQRKRLAQPPTR